MRGKWHFSQQVASLWFAVRFFLLRPDDHVACQGYHIPLPETLFSRLALLRAYYFDTRTRTGQTYY